ncbi:uncharacterized protein PG986_009749 [Apiospora aurea]|uniref:Uncharacterized protein n=1 Tax=Apiospora aurea TaxID=335848 RepID=A0ABR1Q8M7_9PEZI
MLLSTFGLLAGLLPATALRRETKQEYAAASTSASLGFVLTARSLSSQPAIQLGDGRVLFNATGQHAVFKSQQQLGVIESSGLPCNAFASPKFIVDDASNTLLHLGSSVLQLCPQQDHTTYGIYVNPVETYGECVATTIQVSHELPSELADRDDAAPLSRPLSLQIQTVREDVTETVTIVETSTTDCRSITPATSTPADVLSSRDTEDDSLLDARALVPRARGDLNRSWKSIRDGPDKANWLAQGATKKFDVAPGTTKSFATDEYYDCTVFAVVTGQDIHIGHLTGERGRICPLADPDLTSDILRGSCRNAYVVVTGNQANNEDTGVPVLMDFFIDDMDIPSENVRYVRYRHSTPLSEFGDPSDESAPVQGRSLFRWESGTWSIFLGNETPRLKVSFDQESRVAEGIPVEWGESTETSALA